MTTTGHRSPATVGNLRLKELSARVGAAVADGNLITGQNPGSAKATAQRGAALL